MTTNSPTVAVVPQLQTVHPWPRTSPSPGPAATRRRYTTGPTTRRAGTCGGGLDSPGASSIIAVVATVRDQIIDALITDMANDDLTWRPVDVDAERRASRYVATDIAADRSTIASIDEFPGSTNES